ncbi:uncharacterized protein LOC134280964 [Saccostrea cucullata]|uniref:uncharacterized protein LOC134280964 n=1 Tax=Saccostrea cuccullata TaxID=36930 RepID=UPI002ED50F54
MHNTRNDLQAKSKDLRSFLEKIAYCFSLLSVRTTKCLFIHDLWQRELYAYSMEFRLSTLHKAVFMSENKKILSNTNFPSAVAGSADISQQGYYGAKTDRKIAKEQELRLVFFTRIELKKICDFEFIFHVTFCNDEIKTNSGEQDTPHYFSMHAYCDAEKIEIFFMEPEDDDLATLTSYTEGNILIFGFEVNVSGIHGTVSFKELHSGRELHTFKSVDFSIPLIPMFSVSEPNVAESLIILV